MENSPHFFFEKKKKDSNSVFDHLVMCVINDKHQGPVVQN